MSLKWIFAAAFVCYVCFLVRAQNTVAEPLNGEVDRSAFAQSEHGTDDMFATLSQVSEWERSHDDNVCEKLLYSSLSDQWLHAYCQGNDKEAQRLWTKLLEQLASCQSISMFLERTYDRLRFQTPENATNSSRFGLGPFSSSLIRWTERAVGPNHRFINDELTMLASHDEDVGDFAAAKDCRQRQLSILESSPKRNQRQVARVQSSLAYDLCKQHQPSLAEPLLKAALQTAERLHDEKLTRAYVSLYCQLLRSENRGLEAQKLLAKYGTSSEKKQGQASHF